ncbi:MAG: DUF4388 domain-containing protein, partial [Chloroflexota bacterium]|nr:DUF4388 domain-containing protein [Chloroflexota bacterium]
GGVCYNGGMDPSTPGAPAAAPARTGTRTARLFLGAEEVAAPAVPNGEMGLWRLSGPVLAGLISAFPPNAVLSLLNVQGVSGVLYLQNRSLTATIHVDGGEVVGATLGGEQGLGPLFYALSWNTGRFQFRLEAPGPRYITLSLPVIQVRATLWLDRWRDLRRVFPTIWYRIGIHPQPAGEVVIQPHQWQLLTRIVAEPVSLVKLAESLRADVLVVTRVAAELVHLGLAIVVPPDEQEAADDLAELGDGLT